MSEDMYSDIYKLSILVEPEPMCNLKPLDYHPRNNPIVRQFILSFSHM